METIPTNLDQYKIYYNMKTNKLQIDMESNWIDPHDFKSQMDTLKNRLEELTKQEHPPAPPAELPLQE